jgi:type I restriction enzyme S subunit
MWLIGGGIGVSDVHGAVSPDYRVYRLRSELHSRYIHYLLRSQPYRDQYRLYTRADTTFDQRVSKENFHPMPILIPPFDEQRRIADFLDAETTRIERVTLARRGQLEAFPERKFALIRDALSRGLHGEATQRAGLRWLPTCPASWRLIPLKYLVRCLDGKRIPLSAEQRANRKGIYPYYGASSIVDHINDYLFDEPLVLLGEDGAQLGDPLYEVAFFVEGRSGSTIMLMCFALRELMGGCSPESSMSSTENCA